MGRAHAGQHRRDRRPLLRLHAALRKGNTKRTLRQRTGRRAALWLAIVLATIYSAFPFYWLFISSLTHPSRLFSGDLFPTKFSFQSYRDLFSTTPELTWLFNSVVVAV